MKFVKRPHTIMKVFAILTFTAASIQADVIYDFSGTGTTPTEAVAFQLTAADFLNLPASFTCLQLDSSTNCAPQVFPSIFFSDLGVGAFSATLQFDASNNVQYTFFFPTGAFDAPGVYSAETGGTNNPGTLKVTVTPEPATLLLLLTAICFYGLLRVRIMRLNSVLLTKVGPAK